MSTEFTSSLFFKRFTIFSSIVKLGDTMQLYAEYLFEAPQWDCKFHPDRNIIACSGKTLHVINSDGEEQFEKHEKTIRKIQWRNHLLATASFDSTVSLMNIDNRDEFMTIEGHENECKGISFSSDSTMIATCGRDKTVWIWQLLDDVNLEVECMAVLQEHDQDVKNVAFHPYEDVLVSCSYDKTVKLYSMDTDDDWFCQDTFEEHVDTVWDFQFSENGKLGLSCDGSGLCLLWQYFGGSVEYLDSYQLDHSAICVRWMGNLCFIAAEQYIYKLKVEDNSLQFVEIISHPHGIYDVNAIDLKKTNEGYLLATTGDDGRLKLWNLNK
eukprot:NODE_136_length_16465_cov_1.184957.p7 type:complete len:325 gc:universal NODE_136_length_16465_cov_1.184957:13723-14697(+)